MRCLPLLAATLALAAPAAAQIVRGQDIVVGDYYANGVFRVDPATGAATLLRAGAPFQGVADADVTRDGEVLICDWSAGTIFKLDQGGGLTTLASGLPGPIRMAMDHDGSVAVTALSSGQLLRVSPTGAVSTIASGFSRPFTVAVEPDGNYLVTEDFSGRLWRVDRITGAKILLTNGLDLAQGVALFVNGDVAVSSGHPDFIKRVPRAGGSPTLLVGSPPLGNPDDIHADGAGGFFVSESGLPLGHRITHVDALGNLTVVSSSGLFQNPEGLGIAPSLRGPTQVFTGPGAVFSLALDLPADAGRPYRIVAARSAHPGQSLPPFDWRGTPLNPDSVFRRTRQGDLPPITQNWSGLLDANGRASASLDFSTLAPGVFAGTSLHLHAITRDPAAPSGIRSFSNVLTLRF
jgi:hypothetical protein